MDSKLTHDIKEFILKVMYLDDDNGLTNSTALFSDFGMSSLDFVDLCYELETNISSDITPELIWPIPHLMEYSQFWDGTSWTKEGRKKLAALFQDDSLLNEDIATNIIERFTIDFMVSQITPIMQHGAKKCI